MTAPGAVQTVYSQNLSRGFAGQDFSFGQPQVITACVQGEASAPIPFGIVVKRGTSTDNLLKPAAKLPTSSSDDWIGIVRHSHTYNPATDFDATGVGLVPGVVLDVLERGKILAMVEQSVVPGDPVYVRITAGAAGTQVGALRKDSDSGKAIRYKGIRFLAESSAALFFGATPSPVPLVVPVYVDSQFNPVAQQA